MSRNICVSSKCMLDRIWETEFI